MLSIKVVKRINPKSSHCKRKKKPNTPRDTGLPPRDRFIDGGGRSVVGKGLKGSRQSPRQGEAQAPGFWPVSRSKWMGPTSGNTEEVREAAN